MNLPVDKVRDPEGASQPALPAYAVEPRTSAEAAQARLLAALACPISNEPVEVVALETAGEAVLNGAIFNGAGAHIGRIANFQIDFVRHGDGEPLDRLRRRAAAGALPRRVETVAEWRREPLDSPAIFYDAPRILVDDPDIAVIDRPGAAIAFEASGPVEILLSAHRWSGIVEIRHPGPPLRVDLYEPETTIPRPVRLDLGPTLARVEVVLTGEKNDRSLGAQCLFGGFRRQTGRTVALRFRKPLKVRGAPFTETFQRLLDGVPEEGLLLDLGGGNRQIDDAHYINCDYADYAEPDLIGDATGLPLRDASVDAIYSTGVFEHINDPARAGSEVTRVLKPGGRATIAWAFMQPIHCEGQHFYNATPWGVKRAFPALKLTGLWYDTSFAYLVRWGAEVSDLTDRVPAEEIDAVCKTLERWDALIPESRKPYMANGVWAEFEKV